MSNGDFCPSLSCSSCSASCGCESYIFGTGPAAQCNCQEPACTAKKSHYWIVDWQSATGAYYKWKEAAARTLVLDLKFCSLGDLFAKCIFFSRGNQKHTGERSSVCLFFLFLLKPHWQHISYLEHCQRQALKMNDKLCQLTRRNPSS